MKLIKDHYAELISLTQLFLLREHSLKDVKMVDPAIAKFFQIKVKASLPSIPKKMQPPPVPLPSIQNKPPINKTVVSQPSESRSMEAPIKSSLAQPLSMPIPENLNLQIPGQVISITSISQTANIQQDKIHKTKEFSLEPLASISMQENNEWWNLSQTLFPEWVLSKTIPNDIVAQKNKNAWLKSQEICPVMILSFYDNEQQQIFLKNIAQAISLRLAPAQVVSAAQIEKENKWENILNSSQLRLVIAGDYGLYLHPKLMHFYKEIPQQGKHFLNQTPLLLLSDLSLYLKEPQLKPLLWRAICNEFAASQSHRRSEK